ncbi:MAG: RNA methyltransferase [Planctomycetaceae bacterium]
MPFPANVRVVLVQPEYPGNVGSAARAMLTMGLSELYVVAPVCDPQSDEAYGLAHNAGKIVRRLRVVETLAQALADTVFSAGTTRRTRRVHYPIFTPEDVARQVRDRAADQPVALVFGRESSGLTNSELALCSIQTTIPTVAEEHALNLAQAVQIYCYALHQASLAPAEREPRWNLATHAELEHFYAHLHQALARLRTKPASTMESYLMRFRRVISRMPLETRDVNLLHKLLSKVDGGSSPGPGPQRAD